MGRKKSITEKQVEMKKEKNPVNNLDAFKAIMARADIPVDAVIAESIEYEKENARAALQQEEDKFGSEDTVNEYMNLCEKMANQAGGKLKEIQTNITQKANNAFKGISSGNKTPQNAMQQLKKFATIIDTINQAFNGNAEQYLRQSGEKSAALTAYKNLKNFMISVAQGGSGKNFRSKEINYDALSKSFYGYISNIMGEYYEIATALSAQELLNDTLNNLSNIKNRDFKIEYLGGKGSGHTRSKTDISLYNKELRLNFSIKTSSFFNKAGVKLHDTTVSQIIALGQTKYPIVFNKIAELKINVMPSRMTTDKNADAILKLWLAQNMRDFIGREEDFIITKNLAVTPGRLMEKIKNKEADAMISFVGSDHNQVQVRVRIKNAPTTK